MSNSEQVYGIHAVSAILRRQPERIVTLQVLESSRNPRLTELCAEAEAGGITVEALSRQALDALLSDGADALHQGVVATCRPNYPLNHNALLELLERLPHPPLLLILDGVTDPHNLGACLRSAEAAGVDAVIVPKDRAVAINATVRKVACGAADIIPFVIVTNLARTLKSLKDKGIWIFGTAGEASRSIYQSDLRGPLALLMGAEGKGLRRLSRDLCDHLVHIPMAGDVSSLNVSVATGVCLFEALRQRQYREPV